MVALDEVDLFQINPPIDFVSQKITMTFGVKSDRYHEIARSLGFAKDSGQKFTPSSGFAKDTQREQIGMKFGSLKQTWLAVEVNDYHLIFDLNGVLVATSEGQIRSHPNVLRLGLKEFLFACVKKFTMYIWSLAI
jgi:hypothetical protein